MFFSIYREATIVYLVVCKYHYNFSYIDISKYHNIIDVLLYHGTAMFLVQFFSCHFKSYSVLILNDYHNTVTLTNVRVYANVCFLCKNGFRHNLATHGKHSFQQLW